MTNAVDAVAKASRALVLAFRELNEIRARDGVPYTSFGYASSVDPEWFSHVVDEVDEAILALTGHGGHCHPLLYVNDKERSK